MSACTSTDMPAAAASSLFVEFELLDKTVRLQRKSSTGGDDTRGRIGNAIGARGLSFAGKSRRSASILPTYERFLILIS